MSRAFVKEDVEVPDVLPERPVSGHRNFVTASGLARIEEEVARLRHLLAEGQERQAAQLARDLRYWSARLATAELVQPAAAPDEVRFGTTVTIERGDGRRQTFRIVGEDEADPKAGTLSYVSPLARALIGRISGDTVAFMGDELMIVAVV